MALSDLFGRGGGGSRRCAFLKRGLNLTYLYDYKACKNDVDAVYSKI